VLKEEVLRGDGAAKVGSVVETRGSVATGGAIMGAMLPERGEPRAPLGALKMGVVVVPDEDIGSRGLGGKLGGGAVDRGIVAEDECSSGVAVPRGDIALKLGDEPNRFGGARRGSFRRLLLLLLAWEPAVWTGPELASVRGEGRPTAEAEVCWG